MLPAVEELRLSVEKKYIGFSPISRSVKPVHIANGLFRRLLGATSETELLNRFVFIQGDSGDVPAGHELEDVYSTLTELHRIDTASVPIEAIAGLRRLVRGVVNADKGVYLHSHRMESYTAGNSAFVSEDRVAQDGGELFGAWLEHNCPEAVASVTDALADDTDAITMLCSPLLSDLRRDFNTKFDFSKIESAALVDRNWSAAGLPENMVGALNNLVAHLMEHPSKLVCVRHVIQFASLWLIRHLATLEERYVPSDLGGKVPFLVDFSPTSGTPVAQASSVSYTLTCQAISRFYAWALGEELKSLYRLDEILESECPKYRNKVSREMEEIWDLAVREAQSADAPFRVIGQAYYDILALEAEGNPVVYMRQLGWRVGLLWPPSQAAKRYVLQEGVLETIVRSAIPPGHTLSLSDLQEQLWNQFGIVIGGRPEDEERLLSAGLYQADAKALLENRERFAERLARLGFAKLLADGVLKIEAGD